MERGRFFVWILYTVYTYIILMTQLLSYLLFICFWILSNSSADGRPIALFMPNWCKRTQIKDATLMTHGFFSTGGNERRRPARNPWYILLIAGLCSAHQLQCFHIFTHNYMPISKMLKCYRFNMAPVQTGTRHLLLLSHPLPPPINKPLLGKGCSSVPEYLLCMQVQFQHLQVRLVMPPVWNLGDILTINVDQGFPNLDLHLSLVHNCHHP